MRNYIQINNSNEHYVSDVISLIAEWEVRQLIIVQGSRISASVYLFVHV